MGRLRIRDGESFAISPEQDADSLTWLATSPEATVTALCDMDASKDFSKAKPAKIHNLFHVSSFQEGHGGHQDPIRTISEQHETV